MRNFSLSESFLEEYKNKPVNWGYGALSYLTYKRSYARKLENGKTEEWWQTVQRVVEGTFSIQKKHCNSFNLEWNNRKAQKSAQIMFEKIFNFKFLPPGRGIWAMGTGIIDKLGSSALNNCAYTSTENIDINFTEPFEFLMDFSMCGVGIGFDTKGANKIKILQHNKTLAGYKVEDSREGWVKALKLKLEQYRGGPKYDFDFSDIRPAGTPIKTFGGIAPGPKPLEEMLNSIDNILSPLIDKPITSVVIVDLMNVIGKCVVSGNIRRTALIAIGDCDDKDYIEMKDPIKYEKELQSHRWSSNNSIYAKLGQDYTQVADMIAKNGEPGVIWMENVKTFGRKKDGEDTSDYRAAGFNPSLRKGTKVLTKTGIIDIDKLENTKFQVKNLHGNWENARCWLSGKGKPLYKITFYGGHEIYCTEEHKWPVQVSPNTLRKFETSKLRQDDKIPFPNMSTELGINPEFNNENFTYDSGFLVGWLFGDGWISKRKTGAEEGKYTIGFFFSDKEYYLAEKVKAILNNLKENESNITKNNEKHWQIQVTSQKFITWLLDTYKITGKSELPKSLFSSNEEFRKGFIDGLFSSDGSVCSTGASSEKQVKFVNKNEKFTRELASILSFYGIKTSINRHTTDLNNKIFHSWVLKFNGVDSRDFGSVFKFSHKEKQQKLMDIYKKGIYENRKTKHIKYAKVKSVELTTLKEDVWDISVYDDTHCFYTENCITGNCVEQCLESSELCTLVETFPANHESAEEYLDTLKYAYMYGKTVTLIPTHWPKSNAVMGRNRRIGTSMSGIQQAITKFGRRHFFDAFCNAGYSYIKNLDRIYSEWLCIPKSIRITTVKPSGTVSILAGAFPGVHQPHSRHYIRNVRFGKNSPYVKALQKAGYLTEEDYYDPYSVVVSFPIEESFYKKSKFETSLFEQFKNASDMQHYWSDNGVSCTITFNDQEKSQIADALEMYEKELKAVSLLPLQGHSYIQAPYIEIDDTVPESKRFKKGYKLAWTTEEFENYKKQINEKVLYREIAKLNELEDGAGEKYCSNDSCELPPAK